MNLRHLRSDEWRDAAEVICFAIRDWYAAHGSPGRFPGGPESVLLFPQVYEVIDPGRCAVVEDGGRIAGLCFYHPRDFHISVGIVAVRPEYFGKGVGRKLLELVCDFADEQRKPLRLVSSAHNLDSFSLYTRCGFVPRAVYHTMNISVPSEGIAATDPLRPRIRAARPGDAHAMAELEQKVSGIRREKDFEYFIADPINAWRTSVFEIDGRIDGFLVSIRHPGCEMLGPGVMTSQAVAAALVGHHLDEHHRDGSPTFLIPAAAGELVQRMYALGARNCEVHLLQTRGEFKAFEGVSMGTFMPETG